MEARVNINIPFHIGQKVYAIEYRTYEVIICPTCCGKGYKSSWEDEYGTDHYTACPPCNSSGCLKQNVSPQWVIVKHLPIEEISINYEGISIKLYNSSGFGEDEFCQFDESQIFRTKRKALAECKRKKYD